MFSKWPIFELVSRPIVEFQPDHIGVCQFVLQDIVLATSLATLA